MLGFPDVCKTPIPISKRRIPIAYPNVAMRAKGQKGQKKVPGKKVAKLGTISAVKVRNRLNQLHAQLTSLSGNEPDRWHELLDEYVIAAAELYMTLASD